MFWPEQSDTAVMASRVEENQAQLVAAHCDFLEVGDTKKGRLLKL